MEKTSYLNHCIVRRSKGLFTTGQFKLSEVEGQCKWGRIDKEMGSDWGGRAGARV